MTDSINTENFEACKISFISSKQQAAKRKINIFNLFIIVTERIRF